MAKSPANTVQYHLLLPAKKPDADPEAVMVLVMVMVFPKGGVLLPAPQAAAAQQHAWIRKGQALSEGHPTRTLLASNPHLTPRAGSLRPDLGAVM